MDDRKKGRGEKQRDGARSAPQQHPENESAKEQLLYDRDRHDRANHAGHFSPEERLPEGVDVEPDQGRPGAKQRKSGNGETGAQVSTRRRVFLEPEIAPAPHPQRAQERPEQEKCGEEKRAMEVALEVEAGESRKRPVRDHRLTEPEERRRGESAEEENSGEISEKFEGGFQKMPNLRGGAAAPSTLLAA